LLQGKGGYITPLKASGPVLQAEAPSPRRARDRGRKGVRIDRIGAAPGGKDANVANAAAHLDPDAIGGSGGAGWGEASQGERLS
jgi:hypothetical protein